MRGPGRPAQKRRVGLATEPEELRSDVSVEELEAARPARRQRERVVPRLGVDVQVIQTLLSILVVRARTSSIWIITNEIYWVRIFIKHAGSNNSR